MRISPLLASLCCLVLVGNAHAEDNTLTDQEKQDGWVLLFNGKDHTGWKCNNGKEVASKIEENALVPHKSGGYLIVHEKQFGDYILKCDAKMSEGCNSGVFFRIGNLNDPVNTGFEMQVMVGSGTSKHDYGAIYDLVPPTKNMTKGPGEWDSIEIRCEGPMIQVTVNGEMVSEMNCDDFDKPGLTPAGNKHKFQLDGKPRAVADFDRKGYLGFQDHGAKVWFKNIKLKELK
ncbi:MAG: DUF1080 domain-containing protein [Pirellulaceae bacterium]